jgi:hypothetical protein
MKARNSVIVLLTGAALAFLGGCSTAQLKANVGEIVKHDVAVQLAPVAIPDLQKAGQQAAAANDTEGVDCTKAAVRALTEAAAAQPPSVLGKDANGCLAFEFYNGTSCQPGAAVAIEQLRLNANAAAPAPEPLLPDYLVKGCAVVAYQAKLDIAQFLAQLGLNAATFKVGGAAGAAAVIQKLQAGHKP